MGKTKTDVSNTLPASFADRHQLYQWSVQVPEFEIRFMDKVFRKVRGRSAVTMREDFCGTGALSCEWAKLGCENRAIGLDLDEQTLAWGREHNVAALPDGAGEVVLNNGDVRTVTEPGADIVCAYNFSWFLINPLAELIDYFRVARQSLVADGLLFLDCYGGWEAQQSMVEPRMVECSEGMFTYTWEQARYDPITNHARCHIHFELDGIRMKKAFTYDWRLYSLAEARDALIAAGFSDVIIYWDKSDDPDSDNYKPAKKAKNQPGWLAYIVGVA